MANPVLKVYLSHAPEAPTWALDGVVDILRQLQAVRGKPYELRYGYAAAHGRAEVLPVAEHLRHGSVGLAEADLVFALATREYFSSEYIDTVERPLLEERMEDKRYAGVIPIVFDATGYAEEWLAEHRPRTIAFTAGLAAGQAPMPASGSTAWLTVSEKVAERLLGVAAIQRSRQREERRIQRLIAQEAREQAGYGAWPYLAFAALLAVIVAGSTIEVERFFAGPRTSPYAQERTFRAGLDLAARSVLLQSDIPGADDPGSADPGPYFDELIRPDAPAEYDSSADASGGGQSLSGEAENRRTAQPANRQTARGAPSPEGASGQSPTLERGEASLGQADTSGGGEALPGERDNRRTPSTQGSRPGGQARSPQASGRAANQQISPPTNYPTQNYGRYESCQAYNENGFRPCKLNRRWYIVNESRNIHHLIDFPVSTHEDIYAIRPFYDGIAEVFYFQRPERIMYRSFCVALNDEVVGCDE